MYNLCQLNSEPFLFRVSSDTVLYILYWTLGNKVRHFVSTLCRNLFVRCINPHWQIPPILKFMSTKKKERWSQLTKRQNWLIREDRDMLLLQLFHYPYCPLSSLLASPEPATYRRCEQDQVEHHGSTLKGRSLFFTPLCTQESFSFRRLQLFLPLFANQESMLFLLSVFAIPD
jgi:hypothetical protein